MFSDGSCVLQKTCTFETSRALDSVRHVFFGLLKFLRDFDDFWIFFELTREKNAKQILLLRSHFAFLPEQCESIIDAHDMSRYCITGAVC